MTEPLANVILASILHLIRRCTTRCTPKEPAIGIGLRAGRLGLRLGAVLGGDGEESGGEAWGGSVMRQQGCHYVTGWWIRIEIVHIFVYPLYLLLQIQMFEYNYKFEWVNSSQSNTNTVFASPPASPKGPPRTDFIEVVRPPIVTSFWREHPPPPSKGV
jgi:hypothetical protein